MGRGTGFIGLVVVIALVGYVFSSQLKQIVPGGALPETAIVVTGVRNDLIAMANSERRYWALNAKYASLEVLRADGDIHVPKRPEYTYSGEATDNGFRITATYSGTDPKAPKRFMVDETMAISSN